MGASVLQLYASGRPASNEWAQTEVFVLKLFVSGMSPGMESSIETLRRNLDNALEGNYLLTVHDVQEEPQLAEDEKILATPTLVKTSPHPAKRVIGDLSAIQTIFSYFGMPSDGSTGSETIRTP